MGKLGQLLIHRRLIRVEQLDEALDSQILNGGRLGTNLIELGHLTEEQLATALHEQHGVATAHGEIVPHPSALEAIRPELCDRYNLIPLRVEGPRLYIGVVGPFSQEQLAELGRRLGREVHQLVIPEFRLHQLLRRYAKAFRPIRAVDLSHGSLQPAGPAGPEQAPELMSEEAFQSIYAQALTGGRLSNFDQASAEHDAYAPPGETGLGETGPGEAPHPDASTVFTPRSTMETAVPNIELVLGTTLQLDTLERRSPGGSAEAPFLDRRTAMQPLEPITFAEAQAALATIEDRHGVATVVMRFAASKFTRALLLAIHGEVAIGWAGVGPGLEGSRARRIAVPLSKGSPFGLVRDSSAHFLGPLRQDAAVVQFLRMIGGAPQTALLMPILARGRVVNILYADHGPDALTQPDVAELLILTQKVGRSFEAILARRKAAAAAQLPPTTL